MLVRVIDLHKIDLHDHHIGVFLVVVEPLGAYQDGCLLRIGGRRKACNEEEQEDDCFHGNVVLAYIRTTL